MQQNVTEEAEQLQAEGHFFNALLCKKMHCFKKKNQQKTPVLHMADISENGIPKQSYSHPSKPIDFNRLRKVKIALLVAHPLTSLLSVGLNVSHVGRSFPIVFPNDIP